MIIRLAKGQQNGPMPGVMEALDDDDEERSAYIAELLMDFESII